MQGFAGVDGTEIIVFYPATGTSRIQRLQMTTPGEPNVHAVGIRGNFDDAQAAVKRIFADEGIRAEAAKHGITLSSANSINTGRLVPQIAYYVLAGAKLNGTDGGSGAPAPMPEDVAVSFLPTGKVRPAEKRNIGIKAAKGEIVAFIDDDAYPDAHWIEYAVRYFGDETVGAVGGPGVTPPNDPFLARIGGRVYDNLLVSGNYRYRYKAGGVRRDVDDYPSCNLFVGKSLLDSFGGYRTDFWPGEDTLLCKDIVDSGKRIVYDPWVVVCHHRRALFGPHLRQLGRYAFHRGYFVKRFPSNSLHLSYFVPSLFVLYLFVWAALVMIPQPDEMSFELFCIWQFAVSCI
jgi:hypothetical protein